MERYLSHRKGNFSHFSLSKSRTNKRIPFQVSPGTCLLVESWFSNIDDLRLTITGIKNFLLIYVFIYIEVQCQNVAISGLEPTEICLPLLPDCWDERNELQCQFIWVFTQSLNVLLAGFKFVAILLPQPPDAGFTGMSHHAQCLSYFSIVKTKKDNQGNL